MSKPKIEKKALKTQVKDSSTNTSFGPSLGISRPIEMKNNYKKLIHYDCYASNVECEEDEDIPEENEVYIKENLLYKRREEPITEQDDDISIININVSKLLSSSGSASKNSNTFNYSNGTLMKQSPNVGTCGNNTSSSNSKKGGISSSSIESNKIKKTVTTKRKILYDKLMKKQKANEAQSQEEISQVDENELKDVMTDCEFTSDLNNKSTNHNVKITNITNIILNVKNYGKSFDVQRLTNGTQKDKMMKDMKSLHLITQKALTSKNKNNPVDSFDDERTSFFNFRNSSNNQKEFYISDNSGISIGKNEDVNKSVSKKSSLNITNEANDNKQSIINIININNNYSIDKAQGVSTSTVGKMQKKPLYMHTEPPAESFRSSKAKLSKAIPKSSNIKGLPVKDFISAIKNDQKIKKGRFIALGISGGAKK